MPGWGDAVYDVECYPNFFCVTFILLNDREKYTYEISDRRNDSAYILQFLMGVDRLIGFNCMGYDWPMLDFFMSCMASDPLVTPVMLYRKTEQLVEAGFRGMFQHIIWKPQIPQIDLFLIFHLERFSVGLKQLEMTMRAREVRDLPFPPGTVLTHEEMDVVIDYNANVDVPETLRVFEAGRKDIAYRETLGPEWINYNDGKIGSKTFEGALIANGIELWSGRGADRRKRQTRYPDGVLLGDVVLPIVKFTRGSSTLLLEKLKAALIQEHETRGGFHTEMDLDGFNIDIKLGGIHGSIERTAVNDRSGRIRDFDVTSYYPSLAIVHRIYPKHLGPKFCDIYADLKRRRIALSDGDPVRSTLKYALNVPFGQSNEPNSIFYDPAYMLAITINGQLMLCMLAEQMANAGIRILQVNTDGITVQHTPDKNDIVDRITSWWSAYTGMDLEEKEFSDLRIRDANNYIGKYKKGGVKRIGAYDYIRTRLGISKLFQSNNSKLVVARAAEAAMFDDIDPDCYLHELADPWDFLLFRKGKMRFSNGDTAPRNLRYYVSTNGQGLAAVYAPLKGKTEDRLIGVHAEGQASASGKRGAYACSMCGQEFRLKSEFDSHNGTEHSYKVTPAMIFDGTLPDNIDYSFYRKEIEKLIIE